MNEVSVRVNGVLYGAWKGVRITAGINRLARDFVLSITTRWPNEAASAVKRIGGGDLCQVYIDDELLLTGYVDATPISYDADQVTMGISGRSKVADLIDCAAPVKQWKNTKLDRIVGALVAPYGIEVVTSGDVGDPISEHETQPGESVAESLSRLLRLRGFRAFDDGLGRLILSGVKRLRATDKLEYGVNIKSGNCPLDYKDRYSKYVVQGQRSGTDQDAGSAVSEIEAIVKDNQITRHRELLIIANGQMDNKTAKERATWEARRRAGLTYETDYIVAGWRQSDGALWLPNMLVMVVDPIIGLDVEMLTSEVAYIRNEQVGTNTNIKVAPPHAYELGPYIPKAKNKSGFEVKPGETVRNFN